jgi:tetratricopeptide (TPR) repeat protein
MTWAVLLCLGLAGGTELSVKPPVAEDPVNVWVRANDLYAKGDYGAARDAYVALLQHGVENGYLYYNLGNSYLRLGDLGQAIAAYLQSQSLLPRNADVAANLAFARKSAKDAIEPRQSAAILRTLFFWHFALSKLELLQIVVVSNLLFWSLLAWRLLKRESEINRWLSAFALVVLLALGSSLLLRYSMPRQVAVVHKAEVDVHSGTSDDTVVTFKLHAGTEADWLETRGAWLRLGLPDGKQGWVRADDVQALTL